MVEKRWILPAALLVAACAAAAVPASTELTRPGTIRITSSEVVHKTVDISPTGRSAGDLMIKNALLYNRRITQKAIGHSETICTYLGAGSAFGGGSRHCETTVFLPKGKIFVSGATHNMYIYELPVLGGTGLYNNVRGTLTVTYLGSSPRRELLFFRLTI
jgi:hypothetical protein